MDESTNVFKLKYVWRRGRKYNNISRIPILDEVKILRLFRRRERTIL